MKNLINKPVISLVFCLGIMSSISCSNENNNAQSEIKTGGQNLKQIQSTAVALNTEAPSAEVLSHGEDAHNNHCYKCHSDEVYTRDNRFVKSIDALSKQVVRCKDSTEAAWFDEDAEAVVQFLNQKYYKF